MHLRQLVKKNKQLLVIISLILIILGEIVVLYLPHTSPSLLPSITTITPSPSPAITPYPTEIPARETTDCAISNNWATVRFTNITNWKCSVQNYHDNTIYYIALVSGRIRISVTDSGRDGYCDGSDCVITDFFTTPNMHLFLYTYKGEDKEIWGNFPPTKNGEYFAGHISIKYDNMETNKLTAEEKEQIFSLLNSLTYSFTKK